MTADMEALVAKINSQPWPYSFPRPTVASLTQGTAQAHERMAGHLERKGQTAKASKARRAATAVRGK